MYGLSIGTIDDDLGMTFTGHFSTIRLYPEKRKYLEWSIVYDTMPITFLKNRYNSGISPVHTYLVTRY